MIVNTGCTDISLSSSPMRTLVAAPKAESFGLDLRKPNGRLMIFSTKFS
jgi:hypothetical protein